MTENLVWKMTVRAEGGPQLTSSGTLAVEAYDKLSVVVPAGGDVAVDLGPAGSGQITCLVIVPSAPSDDLSYEVGGDSIKLDQSQFLLGGAVNLTGNPAGLTLANAGGQDSAVDILVGRDATP